MPRDLHVSHVSSSSSQRYKSFFDSAIVGSREDSRCFWSLKTHMGTYDAVVDLWFRKIHLRALMSSAGVGYQKTLHLRAMELEVRKQIAVVMATTGDLGRLDHWYHESQEVCVTITTNSFSTATHQTPFPPSDTRVQPHQKKRSSCCSPPPNDSSRHCSSVDTPHQLHGLVRLDKLIFSIRSHRTLHLPCRRERGSSRRRGRFYTPSGVSSRGYQMASLRHEGRGEEWHG
ncbi:uncharacterized protein BDZ99DRAFT_219115 [Mytilinidion resinicola]|uniref:Uncharacterized protein n=1 Tax=Mytilinidion resinicola TaxID=574789 RepID=A0A6A6XZ58_9PEZI|nr:uncharacterized protein BDZ99DRAFT_219115 [Mytilinidion resinicola]KAF2801543.1 hypothetical protein BDZ99DRAFT_219115 [Mytilinidion resinicola]